MISADRKFRRIEYEAKRAAKLREAIDALVTSRRTPWYNRWMRRVDRNKYHADGRRRGERV